jgi:uncharacterized membrane protein
MGGSTQRELRGTVRQRGAVAIWVGISIVALVTAAFLAIDTGRLYYTQRELQRLASLSAMAGTQIASGCSGVNADGSLGSLAAVTATIESFIRANGGKTEYLTGVNGTAPVELGTMVRQENLLVFQNLAEGDERINAVRVNLSRPQPVPFIGFLTGGSTLQASATAQQPLIGTFTVGSTLLNLDTTKSALLNPLLQGLLCANPGSASCAAAINISAVGYQGLANVGVSLPQLGTAVGVEIKDVSDLLELKTQTPVLNTVLSGLASSLSGSVSSNVSALLINLAAASSGNPNEIPLGNLLAGIDNVAGAVPFVNLLDLILALGESAVADPSGAIKPIQLPVKANIPGVTSLNAFIKIGEPPRLGGGRPGATAHTAQIRLMLRLQVDALSSINNLVMGLLKVLHLNWLLSITAPPINIGTDIEVAPSTAYLDRLQCPGLSNPMPIAELSASTAVADVKLGTFTGKPASAPELSEASAPLVTVVVKLAGGLASATVNVSMDGPTSLGAGDPSIIPLDYPVTEYTPIQGLPSYAARAYRADIVAPSNPQTVGTTEILGSTFDSVLNSLKLSTSGSPSTGLCVLLICIPLDKLVDGVINGLLDVLTPVLTGVGGLLDALIDPLLQLLGIQVGAATVTMQGISTARTVMVSTCIPNAALPRGCLTAPPLPPAP